MAASFSKGLNGTEPRAGRRNLKGDMREQAILEGAYETLRTESMRTVSIDDLTKSAGLSRSSFYFYFESKWQVLSALLSSVTDDVFKASAMIFDRPAGVPPEVAIEHAVSEVIDVWKRHGHILREVGDAAAAEPALQAQWDKILGGFIDAAAAAIERDRAAGVAIDGPPARSLAAALMWMGERNLGLMSMRSANAIRMEDMVETVTTVWLRTVFGLEYAGTSKNT
ncbi:TetR/AcrR family transcriptional regulator [Nocardia speluncae]|uniref:TetR/AcrR family transcriptional regulator n=1 Tax=Nocardia speluncae TaxID=419477 RepID=A0A846XE64_9NOCA|nr:TetR/AcrR family transcriptional regulator [Nocardia speluncae]NKY33016.1 TetR/AcrR family transcriptional regulator [Nocardia speluncae]